MSNYTVLATAFITGLLGATHCVSMCGGIACVLSSQLSGQNIGTKLIATISFNFGRIISYSLAGMFVSGSIQNLLNLHQSTLFLQGLHILAAVMMILLGLHLTRWFSALGFLERAGGRLWQYVSPLAANLLRKPSAFSSLPLGMLWGWLPCGLVYSTLTLSAAQANWLQGGLVMTAFGLGTFSIMTLITLFGASLTEGFKLRSLQIVSGILLMGLGLAQLVK